MKVKSIIPCVPSKITAASFYAIKDSGQVEHLSARKIFEFVKNKRVTVAMPPAWDDDYIICKLADMAEDRNKPPFFIMRSTKFKLYPNEIFVREDGGESMILRCTDR